MHCCSLKHASSLFSKILTTEVLNSSRHFLVEWNESCVKASLTKPNLWDSFEGSRKVISIHLLSIPQARWHELVEDIEQGRISSTLALEPKLRSRLEALMKPDPKRAKQLREHFQDGFRGIAKRVWPHLNLVLAVDSGSNQIYGEMLRENYCQGVPFYSPFYAATEGKNQHNNTFCHIVITI